MAKKSAAPKYWKVEIARAHRDPPFPDHLYKPGDDITLDADTLARFQAEEGLVTNVVAVD